MLARNARHARQAKKTAKLYISRSDSLLLLPHRHDHHFHFRAGMLYMDDVGGPVDQAFLNLGQ